ncbi:uncharacterized protein FIBRA_02305 [Fibroporia radiculosa]|uniref:Pentacotripeptide-repeat region of PRORP domain-containing protein n=1 Tax=Fibroporia radiculosa TaxID=599839 RepID=J4GMS6_9APHY|nr:uncharacterized protein FIBRA_02305 [Fibroporia radiculosa]CCM00275.1 predicted protein [Fibroporia radiculosa]
MQRLQKHLRNKKDVLARREFFYFIGNKNNVLVDNRIRFYACERAIALFLRHGFPLSAAMVCGRMVNEGFVPSVSARTQMALITLAERSPDENTLLEAIAEYCRQASFDERCMRDVVHLLHESMGCSPEIIDKAINVFIRSQDLEYSLSPATVGLLVHIHGCAGSIKGAQHWLSTHRPCNPQHSGTMDVRAHPYTTLLRRLADEMSSEHDDHGVYRWVFEQMVENNIIPDVAFYNAFMNVEIKRRRYPQGFTIYRLLWHHRTGTETPDAYTYSLLFQAFRKTYESRSFRNRRTRRPDSAPTPRQLYRDMYECHCLRTQGKRSKPSAVITLDTLHNALYMFLQARDYPAAFVVLRTFRMLGLKPRLYTYQLICSLLLRRIYEELPLLSKESYPDRVWSYRFLGMASYPIGQSVPKGMPLLAAILRLGTVSRLSLSYIPVPPETMNKSGDSSGESKVELSRSSSASSLAVEDIPHPEVSASVTLGELHNMPSAELVVQTDSKTDDTKEFALAPLERVLRRAILSTRPSVAISPAKEVAVEIAEAKREMISQTFGIGMYAGGLALPAESDESY